MSYAQIAQKKKESNDQPTSDEAHVVAGHVDNTGQISNSSIAASPISLSTGLVAASLSSPPAPFSPSEHSHSSYRGGHGGGRYTRGRGIGRGGRGGSGRDYGRNFFPAEHVDRNHEFHRTGDYRFNHEQPADDTRSRPLIPSAIRSLGPDK